LIVNRGVILKSSCPLEFLAALGALEVENRQWDEAEKDLREVLAKAPDHVEANFALGLLYSKRGDYDRATPLLRRVMQLRPDHVKAEYELYMIYARTKQPALSQAALAKWREWEALDREVRRELANLEHAREARYGHSQQAADPAGVQGLRREY
jgi:lipopolysaccharide biosynthesis regulator YciM